ncbi:phenylacetate--CoA ligase family protein [Planosporangium mesophilum]|nr:AMP-binding protein [Planosporangium mesophilum]NJC85923.1 phenylacetate--CoA ligase [Planosporangium mesophilum]
MSFHVDPEVETRPEPAQRERDRHAYRVQLAYLFDHSSFYRRKLTEAGFPDATDAGDLDGIAALPFTTKDEIRRSQAEHPPYGDHLAAPADGIRRVYSTSGTTGEPCYIPVTAADLGTWSRIGARSYTSAGVRAAQRIVLTYNAGPFVAGAVLDSLTAIGATVIPVGSGNTERVVRAFQRLGAETLACTPSYALYLTEWCAARGLDPAGLGVRRLCLAGEPGGGEAAIRSQLEAAFRAIVTEAMGIGDVSPSLWGECDDQQGMHFCGQDYVHIELVDPASGQPLAWRDGAEGELVYTALRREAVPMLRLRSRDRVVVNARPCPCGRTSVRVRCVGRTDDLLIVRGVNVFPTAVRAVVHEFRPRVSGAVLIRPRITGVRQDQPPTVLVELADAEQPDDGLAGEIETAIRAKLVARMRVELVRPGTLPRSEYKLQLVDYPAGPPETPAER